jgi:hypothetical protein
MRKILLMAVMSLFMVGCGGTSQEELDKKQKEQTPYFISQQNDVKLYGIYDVRKGQVVYFTTSGDVNWTVPGDDDNPPKHFQTVKGKK